MASRWASITSPEPPAWLAFPDFDDWAEADDDQHPVWLRLEPGEDIWLRRHKANCRWRAAVRDWEKATGGRLSLHTFRRPGSGVDGVRRPRDWRRQLTRKEG